MLTPSYFARAYFGALMPRRPVVSVVDLADVLRQVLLRFDRLEQLLMAKG